LYNYIDYMTIIKETCRMHDGKSGNKQITLKESFAKQVKLPVKESLLVEYNTETRVLTIQEL